MALLQLAEGMEYLAEETNPMKDYIFIPSGMLGVTEDTYVRQDFFDGLEDKEYEAVISSLAPFQNSGLSAIGMIATAVGSQGIKIAKDLIAQKQKRVASGTANPLLKGKSGSLISKVKSAVEKFTKPQDQTKKLPEIDVQGNVGGTNFELTTPGTLTKETWWSKQNNTTKGLIIGGGALVVALVGYKVITKK